MAVDLDKGPEGSRLPNGRIIELAGRGAAFVREVPGPPGAPAVVLLHGLTATADLNWSACFDPLGRSFRVLAPDLRGHGRSPRSWARFTLEDCADDVAALADAVGVDRMIAVGYSIGGLVAQLVWHRRPELVTGLVLCATAADFRASPVERLMLMSVPTFGVAIRFMPPVFQGGTELVGAALFGHVTDDLTRRWMSAEMRRADLATVIDAGCAAASFTSRRWIGEVDVPTAVVITSRDRVVPPTRQVQLARTIPGATIHPVDADHGACIAQPQLFVPTLVQACRSVADRSWGDLTARDGNGPTGHAGGSFDGAGTGAG
ncbi:MAG: alpha/beta fold hydrolase [Acidimicrobiales bacterium]